MTTNQIVLGTHRRATRHIKHRKTEEMICLTHGRLGPPYRRKTTMEWSKMSYWHLRCADWFTKSSYALSNMHRCHAARAPLRSHSLHNPVNVKNVSVKSDELLKLLSSMVCLEQGLTSSCQQSLTALHAARYIMVSVTSWACTVLFCHSLRVTAQEQKQQLWWGPDPTNCGPIFI